MTSESQPVSIVSTDPQAVKGKFGGRAPLWWAASILFILHRALLTWASIHTAKKLHEHWTWYQVLVRDLRHWDAGWYIEIAKYGYFKLSETAFFPLYPLMLRTFHALSGHSYPLVGTVLSSVFFFLSLYVLGRLGLYVGGLGTAFASMAILASFPMAFFFDSMYAESLFLFLTLMAAYMSLQGKFWRAGLFAGLATLTRNTGMFMDLVLFFDYLSIHSMGLRFWKRTWWAKLRWDFLSLLLAPFGLALYLGWSKLVTGKALAFIAAERLWGRHYAPPWLNWYATWKMMQAPHPISFHYYLLEFCSFSLVVLFLIIGLWLAKKSLNQFGWWLYSFTVTYIGSSEPSLHIKDYLLSFPRFVLMLFPVFIYLTIPFRPKWTVIPVVIGFAWLLAWYTGIFSQGMWIA